MFNWWSAIAGGSVGQVEGYLKNANIKSTNALNTANAAASNRVRRASNTFAAARGALARYVQSVGNNESLEQSGRMQAAQVSNTLAANDQLTAKGMFDGVSQMEQAGSAVASQGAAGVGGQVADAVNSATALRAAFVGQALKDQRLSVNYGSSLRAQTMAMQMTRGLDSNMIVDSIDYNEDVPWITAQYSNFSNMIRGVADSMGQGGALQGTPPQQKQWQSQDFEDMRVRQSNPNYTRMDADYVGDTRLGDARGSTADLSSYTASTDKYALDYGQRVSFNLNVGQSYTSL